MRLTCPNCGAQYEVPDQVIPKEGRDVQCSNCGNTWFCAHPDFAPASQDEAKSETDQLRDTIRDLSEPSDPERKPAPRPRPAPKQRPDPSETAAPPERRNLDPEIADILREEARHEAELREAEARGAMETQPDLGLDTITDDAERRAEQARQRMARLRGEPVDPPPAPNPRPAPKQKTAPETIPDVRKDPPAEKTRLEIAHPEEPRPVSRKEMLPDIEEISSSLRQSDQTEDHGSLAGLNRSPRHKAGGFTRGFAVAIILVVALMMIYANAPAIADSLPEADPMLSAFVALVDQGRFWLQETIDRWN